MDLTNTSVTILNNILGLEKPLTSFLDQWVSSQWFFIFAAAIISAYVAVKVNKYFEDKKRINTAKLIKLASKESLGAFLIVFCYILFWGIGILLFIQVVRWAMGYSPILTLLILIGILGILYDKRKKRKKELIQRFQKKKNSKEI